MNSITLVLACQLCAGTWQASAGGESTPTDDCVAAVPREARMENSPLSRAASHASAGNWWSAIAGDIAASEYRPSRASPDRDACAGGGADDAADWQAPNRVQAFRTRFGRGGFSVVPRTHHAHEGIAWSWGLTLLAWGRPTAMHRALAVEPIVAGVRVEYRHGGPGDLVEWYVNDRRGLEQGFTLRADPAPGDSAPIRIEMTVTGDVTARHRHGETGADDSAIHFLVRDGGALAIRLDELHAFDAAGEALPVWFDLCDLDDGSQALAITVDDARALYPITIDPLATSPAWTAESDQNNALFGSSLAAAGDVNGDGYGDVIVGAPDYDAGQSNEGRAFVYLGSAAGLAVTPSWTAESDQSSAQLGRSVSTAGDVNGDGYADVIVGAHAFDNGQSNEGRAFVYLGSSAGLSTTPSWTAESDQANASFGASVSTSGDVNGDGYGDVIVGAPAYDAGETGEGRTFVYLGSASGLSENSSWTAESDQAGALFGATVSLAGDVDGDGFSDVIVGAPEFDADSVDEGRAFVYLGSAGGLAATPRWLATEGGRFNAGFGSSVAGAGDINGDGFSDVIVGAVGDDDGQFDEGSAFAYHGSASGPSATPNWCATGEQGGANFGASLATAGDVNGDGYADVIIGALGYDDDQSNEGRAFVYYGSGVGLGTLAIWTADGNQLGALLGSAVATAGDVDGDGYSDVIVAAPALDNGQFGEGRVLLYHGSPAGLAATSAWGAEGDQAGAQLGLAVAAAGDVNGDGFGDVIVGAPEFDAGDVDEGRAFVYHGSTSGLAPNPSWFATEGGRFNAGFGVSVAGAGDVNGDGYGDVVVGASGDDDGQFDEGSVYIYHGSPTGLSPDPGWTAHGDQGAASFGGAVAGAGDVNGDGYGDLIVGAAGYDNGQPNEGRAFVYHGSSAGLSATPGWTAEGDQLGALFGLAVATAGDVNGDGYSDVIVAAPALDNGQFDEGRAFVYLGSASGIAATAIWTAEGDQSNALFGSSVSAAGDVNGDGYGDVIVGAPDFDAGQSNEGRALVYLGSATGLDTTAIWTAESDQSSARLGASAASAGDVNGDGYADVIVGAYVFDGGQSNEGRAFVYHGSADGLASTPSWMAEGEQVNASFGRSVSGAGDVDGDGYGDVIVGAPVYDDGETAEGRAFVYLGNEGLGRTIRLRQLRTDATTPVAPLGRSDSETQFRVRSIANSFSGRTRIALQHQAIPLGALFDDQGIVEGAYFDIGNDGLINFNRLVGGLTPGTPYHWRIRARYDTVRTPFQKFGPWQHVPGSGWNETDLRTAGTPPPPPCIGDFDGSGEVDGADLGALLGAWGGSGPPGDLNGDGIVDGADLGAMLGAWGACP